MKVENLNYIISINFLSKYSLLDLVMWRKELKKDYKRVIVKFIEFSSKLNSEDLEFLMEHTFIITNRKHIFKLSYSSSQIKYANTIKRFLQNIFSW